MMNEPNEESQRMTRREATRKANEQIHTLDSTLRRRLAAIRDQLARLRAEDLEGEIGSEPSRK